MLVNYLSGRRLVNPPIPAGVHLWLYCFQLSLMYDTLTYLSQNSLLYFVQNSSNFCLHVLGHPPPPSHLFTYRGLGQKRRTLIRLEIIFERRMQQIFDRTRVITTLLLMYPQTREYDCCHFSGRQLVIHFSVSQPSVPRRHQT